MAEPASSKAMKASPRLVLGRSATIAAIAAVSPVAVARVSSLGRRAGEGRGEEEMKLHLGEKGRAWTTSGLAWPGGQRRRPAMVVRGGEERKSHASSIYGRGVEDVWDEMQQPRPVFSRVRRKKRKTT